MLTPPTPPGEAMRLQVLRELQILDTPPEQELDDLVMLASTICETPIALVSLIDEDRQWFKARVGLEATETPRDLAFCAHAIADHDPDMLIVSDASEDPRFFDNPLVTDDPSIRFYAGAVIQTRDNIPIGTLCAIDRVPRQLNAAQTNSLRALARIAMRQIETRQSANEIGRLSEALMQSNQNLEEFASLAAHDMKAPLRAIIHHADALTKETEGTDSGDRPSRIGKLALRLGSLVDDILSYARLQRQAEAPQTIDVQALATEVVALASETADKPSVRIEVLGPLPETSGDPRRLSIVLRNLVSNAIRYSDHDEPHIEIGHQPGNPIVYFVRDDGIGIPADFHTRIFEPFKRLHGKSSYGGGSGFGLAAVKRIIESLGGRIWLESTPGEGSTFFFTTAPGDPQPQ